MARGDLQVQDLRVIMLLAQARGPLTTADISNKLEIPLRTVQRIINAIEAIPLQLRRDSAGMGGGIKLIGELSLKVTLPSNLVEIAALQVARERMREAAVGTLLREAFEQFTERTLGKLTGEQKAIADRFSRYYKTRQAPQSEGLTPYANLVHKAIDESKVLIIETVSAGEHKPKRREIEPAGVWVTDGRSYVVAFDRQRQAMRTFAIDRIHGARLSNVSFTPRADFDVAAHFKHAMGAFVGDGPVALELTLDAEAKRRMGKKLPSRTAKFTANDSGGGTLRCELPLSDELLAWMVTLGPGVAVVAPAKAVAFVRDAFAARTQAHSAEKPSAAKPKAARAKPEKPIQLPGPLLRKMRKQAQ